MCFIVDNDVRDRFFLKADDADYGKLRMLLLTQGNKINLVHGGKNSIELAGNEQVRQLILELNASGRARQFSKDDIAAEEKKLKKLKYTSNDPHILALARCSRTRVLCTNDGDLMKDFGNASLISGPRGSIYSSPTHSHLLKQHCN